MGGVCFTQEQMEMGMGWKSGSAREITNLRLSLIIQKVAKRNNVAAQRDRTDCQLPIYWTQSRQHVTVAIPTRAVPLSLDDSNRWSVPSYLTISAQQAHFSRLVFHSLAQGGAYECRSFSDLGPVVTGNDVT